MIRAHICMIALMAPLAAQGMVGGGGRSLAMENVRAFQSNVKSKGLVLLVVEGPQQDWRVPVERLAAQGRIAEVPLMIRWEGKGSMPEYYTSQGWPAGPHWALLGRGGEVLAHGTERPTAETLNKALEGSGLTTRMQELAAFVREHPGHMAGRELLLSERCQVAERKMLALQGVAGPAPVNPDLVPMFLMDDRGRGSNTQPTDLERMATLTVKPLPDAQDEEVWGAYADELGRFFSDGAWAAIGGGMLYRAPDMHRARIVSPLAASSPRVKAVLPKVMAAIEGVLVRFPAQGYAWSLWTSFAGLSDADPQPLLDQLTPTPGPFLDWPPMPVRPYLLARARRQKDWKRLAAFAGEVFDRATEAAQSERKFRKTQRGRRVMPLTAWLNERLWAEGAGPLVEAHLALGQVRRAREVMDQWRNLDGWTGAYGQAAGLARKAQQEELARQWETLGAEAESASGAPAGGAAASAPVPEVVPQ